MPILRGLRVVNSVEAGTTNSTQLETLLGDAGRKAEFSAVVGLKGQAKRIASSSSTMNTIVGSSAATGAVVTNPNAIGEIASSPTAMTSMLSTEAGREAFFGAKFHVGKGLDTVIANETATNNNTLAGQMTFARVLTNSASTITANATVATAVAGSSAARTAIIADETAKQTYASNNVSVAKFIEGALGGNPATTTSLDAVLNTSGKVTSILANASAKAIASATSGPVAKLLAKIINLDPTAFSDFATFYGNATRWTTTAGNANARSVCFESPYVKSNLPFSNLSEMIIAAPQSETKPYWDWKKYTGFSGYNYFSEPYGTAVRQSVSWTYNGVHYIVFNVYNASGSSYNVLAFYGWSSARTSNAFDANYPSGLASYGETAVYGFRQVGTKVIGVTQGTNAYYSWNADLTGGTSIAPNISGYTTAQFYDFAYGNSYYVAATGSGLAYSSSAAASSWTMAAAGVDFRFVAYALSKFIAIRSNGAIWTSTNGTSWTDSAQAVTGFTAGNLFYSKIVSNGTTLFLFNKVANKLMTSTNGTNWTDVTLPDSATKVLGITHDGSYFYLATDKGFYTSAAGSTWTLDATVTNYAWMGCLTGTDKFIGGMNEAPGYSQAYQVRNIGFTG